jgi:1-aminocyclopropane-1-carboxylate deaminase/D-cysteine desulfhydrase-like pyridoxal-dependent ACC family enzyme
MDRIRLNIKRVTQDFVVQVKRDDLFPVTGGGNKGRKLIRIFRRSLPEGFNAIITSGSTQSNHTRVCAVMAAERGLEAHLVMHGSKEELVKPDGNLLIALMAGAKTYVVEPQEIETAIDNIFHELKEAGKIPFVIPGGAHCLEGALAYADAIDEIDEFPDVIVLASGTGATQAGILAGLDRGKADTKVIGVSVARKNPRGRDVVLESYREARAYLGIEDVPEREVIFDDRWTYGGYGKTDYSLLKTICDVARQTGLILDPTYTGKAFAAMLGMIETGEIDRKKSVLFWHTGGLLNALVSPDLQKLLAIR